jgi:hypothetical protein
MGAPNYAPGPRGHGFAVQPFGANMNPAPKMAPSALNQPIPPPKPNPVAVAVALGKQPKAATSTPPDEAGPSIKLQPESKKFGDHSDDLLLMVKSNSFSATHPDLNELKKTLDEAGMTFKVASGSTDVASSGTALGSRKNPPVAGRPSCISDPAKQANFWDIATTRHANMLRLCLVKSNRTLDSYL